MKILTTKAEIEAIPDESVRAAILLAYENCFEELVGEGPYELDDMVWLVWMETGEDLRIEKETGLLLHQHDKLEDGDACRTDWEHAFLDNGIWEIVYLVNDEFGHMYFLRDDLDMPTDLRSALDAEMAVNATALFPGVSVS